MEEIWVKIDNNYKVSSLGRVYSEPRMGTKGGIIGCYDKPIDRQVIGYYGKTQQIHILVAQAFPEICGYWFDGAVVHHKNRIKTDNRAENLVVLTRSEHQRLHNNDGVRYNEKTSDNIRKALKGKYHHSLNPNAKPILQYTPDGEFIKEWACIKDACEALNIRYQTVLTYFSQYGNDILYKGYRLVRN